MAAGEVPPGKPIDAGGGRVCASFDAATAAWLSLGTTHPVHGFVEWSAVPAFDEELRGRPDATRAHRERLTSGEHPILEVTVDGRRPALVPDLSTPGTPAWYGRDVQVTVRTPADADVVVQEWRFGAPRAIGLRVTGRLDRPALAEITETDPPRPTGASTTLTMDGARAIADADALPATATVEVAGAHVAWRREAWGVVGECTTDRLRVTVSLSPARVSGTPADAGPRDALRHPELIVRAAVAYIRGCTALLVAQRERAFLTDHRILPLSWTRDAFWQALTLLAADGPGDRERVADHLRWLWTRCERPDGRWVRSHHADGRRKDLAFQADQQLYPMLELAVFWRTTGDLPDGVRWDALVTEAWDAVQAATDPELQLVATDENAADDPALAPFVAASQVLAWYAAQRLAELSEDRAVGPPGDVLRAHAAAVRTAFMRHHGARVGPWAYAVDGQGRTIQYHDANDLPVALAPLLGFCGASDPGWRATMAFGFGPSNPAFVAGSLAGLGSAHTPGTWTLGDIQSWIVARATDDRPRMAAAMDRLRQVAFGDGMLPEAYAADGSERIRHWFAWPGAAMAALTLLDDAGRLEAVLGADGR